MRGVKPFSECARLSLPERQVNGPMKEWSFSSTAEFVVGVALALVVVALVFV
jgi:hypothetical protein